MLAYDITIHKFQGFETGFGQHNQVKYIIANAGSLEWEKNPSRNALRDYQQG